MGCNESHKGRERRDDDSSSFDSKDELKLFFIVKSEKQSMTCKGSGIMN